MPDCKRDLHAVLGNSQRLDGGSMYGNCPRAVWSRWSPPDELGRIPLACRTLLVREPNRVVLFETGIGAFFDPSLRERFGVVETDHVLLTNLAKLGAPHEEIDVVVLSHLHFDHAGGLLTAWEPGAESRLLFPNAKFVVGAAAWERARSPHPRDRASYVPALQPLLEASGRLEIVAGERSQTLGDDYRFHRSDGHTPGLLCAELPGPDGAPVLFAADLIPGMPWMHLPITMGYDRYPERLIDEKRALLEDLETRGGSVFFTHDPTVAIARVGRDAKGRFRGIPNPDLLTV